MRHRKVSTLPQGMISSTIGYRYLARDKSQGRATSRREELLNTTSTACTVRQGRASSRRAELLKYYKYRLYRDTPKNFTTAGVESYEPTSRHQVPVDVQKRRVNAVFLYERSQKET